MTIPILHVQLLGGYRLIYDGIPIIGANPPRVQALLAYLLLHANSPQSRQHLAFLLWPDTLESSARNNLRQFLHQLRQALPNAQRFLVADTNMAYWKTDDGQVIDTQLFARALQEADEAEARSDPV